MSLAFPVLTNNLERQLFVAFVLLVAVVLGCVSYSQPLHWVLLLSWLLLIVAVYLAYLKLRRFASFNLVYLNQSWFKQFIASQRDKLLIEKIAVLCDLQSLILVKVLVWQDNKLQPQWFWLLKAASPQQWHELRSLLFSSS